MGDPSGLFNSLSLIYLLGAGVTVYQMARSWRIVWSEGLSVRLRQMAGGVAFFLLLPIGVLLHEFGHMLAAWSTSSQVLGLHYFLYWGYVEYLPANGSPLLAWYVALAGNFMSYLLGIACLFVAVTGRGWRPFFRVMLAQLGILELAQTLIFYPLISLDPSFFGDWDTIYSFHAPLASWLTLAVHIASLVGMVIFLRVNRTASTLLRG